MCSSSEPPTRSLSSGVFATDLGTAQTAEMDELLVELRDSLRAELGAAPIAGRHLWLRVGRKKEDATTEPKT